jgi:hypothetical protein
MSSLNMIDCNPLIHLGDTPSAFPGSTFVGMNWDAPITLPCHGTISLFLRLETSAVETLGGAKHKVKLNSILVGEIEDPSIAGNQGQDEIFEFPLSSLQIQEIVNVGTPVILRVEVENIGSGFSDDFLIRRYGTRES